jgi:hypothetical protein
MSAEAAEASSQGQVTIPQAVRLLRERYGLAVHPNTLHRWVRLGYLRAVQPAPSGWWRIDPADLFAYVEARQPSE